MASFGENLRKARKARNLTLQDIADSTKIGTRALEALEDERFELLPGGIFNKGFVRSYARCVGLDEEKTVAAYMTAANAEAPETDMTTLTSQVYAAREKAHEPRFALNPGTLVVLVAVIVGLGLGLLWWKEQHKEANEQAAARRQIEGQVVSAAPPVSIPTAANAASNAAPNVATTSVDGTNQSANPAVPAAPGGVANPGVVSSPPVAAPAVASRTGTAEDKSEPAAPVEISISATARAWISVHSDGKRVESLTLDPEKPESRSRSYRAQEKLMLVVGNPAGLSVTYNGKPAGTLGPDGHRATITFTPQGIKKQ